nr:hypothetical protein [Deltaproteobacteria bacterium]
AERLCIAKLDGLGAVVLLTTGADRYFERFGFVRMDRTQLPAPLLESTQLTLPACSTAVAMTKQLRDPSETDRLIDAAIARELAAAGTLVPPWIKFPQIPRRSIGWRMGSGEWYVWMWGQWWERMDKEARDAYRARWVDVPIEWRDWLDS